MVMKMIFVCALWWGVLLESVLQLRILIPVSSENAGKLVSEKIIVIRPRFYIWRHFADNR
jgi:hypothetical protein